MLDDFNNNGSMNLLNQNIAASKEQRQQQIQEGLSYEEFINSPAIKPKRKKIDNYTFAFQDLIGQGSFAKVYKGFNALTEQTVAIKVMEMKDIIERKLHTLVEAEIEIFKSLRHPNVLRCYDVLVTDNNCYIITEYCNNGELTQYQKQKQKITNQESNNNTNNNLFEPLLYDIYQGLLYLERKHIIHRDIKLSNILVKDDVAKIADFGFATFSKESFSDLQVGSPIYMAPEALIHQKYGPKTDVWSFGILLFELYHGVTPFDHCKTPESLQREIQKPFEENMINVSLKEGLKKVICKCLTKNDHERPSFKSLWMEEYIRQLRLNSNRHLRMEWKLEKSKDVITPQSHQQLNEMIEKCFESQKQTLKEEKSQKGTRESALDLQMSNQGYSFEDFLKMSESYEQNSLNSSPNSRTKKVQKQNNSQGNSPKAKESQLDLEMQDFYHKVAEMQIASQKIKQKKYQQKNIKTQANILIVEDDSEDDHKEKNGIDEHLDLNKKVQQPVQAKNSQEKKHFQIIHKEVVENQKEISISCDTIQCFLKLNCVIFQTVEFLHEQLDTQKYEQILSQNTSQESSLTALMALKSLSTRDKKLPCCIENLLGLTSLVNLEIVNRILNEELNYQNKEGNKPHEYQRIIFEKVKQSKHQEKRLSHNNFKRINPKNFVFANDILKTLETIYQFLKQIEVPLLIYSDQNFPVKSDQNDNSQVKQSVQVEVIGLLTQIGLRLSILYICFQTLKNCVQNRTYRKLKQKLESQFSSQLAQWSTNGSPQKTTQNSPSMDSRVSYFHQLIYEIQLSRMHANL